MLDRRKACLAIAGAVAGIMPGATFAQARHFRDKDLSGKDFARQDMSSQDYSRAKFDNSDLSFANCTHSVFKGASFRGATLKYTRFADADLTGADFRDAELLGAGFHNAKLWDANLAGVTLYLARATALLGEKHDKDEDFAITRLRSRIKSTLEDVGGTSDPDNGSMSLRGANLKNALIIGNVARVDFRRADLRGADLTKTYGLNDALLRGATYDDDTAWKVDAASMGAVKAAADAHPAK